ncbi:MAG TPA: tetratricopeptide repeat protein [Candidatus Acidoferrum sp.]|nr:tetratricopeptide repeat protein [Candidatus Acidoferrum sp.]
MTSLKTKIIALLVSALAALGVAVSASAQGGIGQSGFSPGPLGSISAPLETNNRMGTVMVYLRTGDGQPLPVKITPIVRIKSSAGGAALDNFPTRTGEGWLFSQVGVDNSYDILVRADGYLPATQTVKMPDIPGTAQTVIVFMQPLDQQLSFHPPAGQFVLVPKAAKEIQNALRDLQYGHISSGEKHALKAVQISPDNPYAEYVAGLTYLLTNRMQQAKPYLEKSVSVDSTQAPALTALGTVRYQLGDSAGAALVLNKAVQIDPSAWKAQWMLAASYLNEQKYKEALDHGSEALRLGKHPADQVKLVIAQAQAWLGQRASAADTFEAYAKEFPNDPHIKEIRNWIKLLRQPATVTVQTKLLAPAVPAVEIPPRPDWAPPDIDSAKPYIVAGAVCPLPQILKNAGNNAEQLVTTLQEFSATEDFQEVELKHGENVEKPGEHEFKYLVIIDQASPQSFDVREFRTHGSDQVQLPGRIQDTGVAALALALHPVIQPDLDWKCEGLGTWGNQSAWVVHFEQKPKAPNVLSWFQGPLHSDALPLKGRVWISSQSYQVLHLDSDLVKAIKDIDLQREHFSINYAPVSFSQHNVQLWLPESVDTYVQFEGHFLHYYHRFSDFKLFWVGTSQKIAAPKEAQKVQDPNKQQEQ